MTATSLGLGGNPIRFLGAYLTSLSSSLGLAQSPSTCNVTLVEDDCVAPPILFEEPTVGDFKTITVGNYTFAGIITSWNKDIVNGGGRTIRVNMSDPREIMGSVPLILAPGYRTVAEEIAKTECSVLDIFGAHDDANGTGLNLSGWNQSGMPYSSIALALKGGVTTSFGANFNVVGQVANVFGEKYRFIMDEVSARVDPGYRLNSNLVTLNDLIQELSTRHSFDWFVESKRAGDGFIDVTIRIIDRSTDNIDLDIDDFLAANSGFVTEASRGFELRNDVACSVLLGAPVEQLRGLTVTGMANNPVDLTDINGSFTNRYFMPEIEMRYLLVGKEPWRTFAEDNGGFARYTLGGPTTLQLAPIWDSAGTTDLLSQHAVNQKRTVIDASTEELIGKLFDKLKSAAESSYGKRFLFSVPTDVEFIDAAWTADGVSGGVNNPITGATTSDPNEYFRNENGKTRCYVEFKPSVTPGPETPGVLGFGGSFVFGKGIDAPQPLTLGLAGSFSSSLFNIELDKSDWLLFNGTSLYVAGTIEEDNVVRIDSPVTTSQPDIDEALRAIRTKGPQGNQNTAKNGGTSVDKSKRIQQKRGRSTGKLQPVLHQLAYQPTRVFVPTKNKFLRYGPIFSSNVQANSQGKLVIDQDDGFAPWEFGTQTAMFQAMQFKVDNASSNVRSVESADISVEGLPKLSIGATLGLNSNVNSINVNFGNNGVSTSYQLRSYLRVFGELSKDDLAALSLFAARAGSRFFAQDSVSFINRYRPVISKQFAGRGGRSTSGANGGALNFE